MPRRKRARKVVEPPLFKGFRPYGSLVKKGSEVELLYEEYEAIRLADYDMYNHEEASKLMDISRPTFARVYETARRKIAKALVEGKELVSVYGNAHLENDWYTCADCNSRFTIPSDISNRNCPLCNSKSITNILH